MMAQAKTKRPYATNVLQRLLEMLKEIPAPPRKCTAKELVDHLPVHGARISLRTAQRNLRVLKDAGFIVDDGGSPSGWSWPNRSLAGQYGLDINSALTLKLAYEHVKPLMPASLAQELKALADSAEKSLFASAGRNQLANWPDKVRVLQSGPPRTPPPVAAGVHQAVCEALLKKLQLRVRYRAATRGKAREFVVTPLGMVSKDGIIYLVVSREDKDEPATFSLHRILSAELEYADAKPPAGWAGLDAHIGAGHFLLPPGTVEKNQWVMLRFDSEAIARNIEEMPIGAGQTIKKETDGKTYYLVRARIDVSGEFVRWLLQYGEHAEVVKPASLRGRMHDIAASLYSRYRTP